FQRRMGSQASGAASLPGSTSSCQKNCQRPRRRTASPSVARRSRTPSRASGVATWHAARLSAKTRATRRTSLFYSKMSDGGTGRRDVLLVGGAGEGSGQKGHAQGEQGQRAVGRARTAAGAPVDMHVVVDRRTGHRLVEQVDLLGPHRGQLAGAARFA